MRKTWILAALLLLFAASPPAHAQTANDFLIVPGERAGPVSLGMDARGLRDALGQPLRSWSEGGDWTWYYYPENLAVLIVNGSVTRLGIGARDGQVSTRYRTEDGIHLGSSQLDVNVAYGPQTCAWAQGGLNENYYDNGLQIDYVAGVVSHLHIISRADMSGTLRHLRRDRQAICRR